MSRIRSIHPGLWTDDAFMSLSAHARLLYIGLWTEAFDDGAFEWKPRTLKAKIFPVDNVDVDALLAEIVDAGSIREGGGVGKPYGLIRNFRVYQRPKKPNSSGLLRPEDHEYVGLVPNQFPTSTEKPPQVEDGGGSKEDEEIEPLAPVPDQGAREFDELWEAFPRNRTSNREKAEAAFRATKAEERPAILAAAHARRTWFLAECKLRNRTETAGLRFEPHLSNWLESGDWRTPLSDDPLKALTAPMPKLEYVDRLEDEELFRACERVRGKPVPNVQRWGFPVEVVERARQERAN